MLYEVITFIVCRKNTVGMVAAVKVDKINSLFKAADNLDRQNVVIVLSVPVFFRRRLYVDQSPYAFVTKKSRITSYNVCYTKLLR